MDFKKCNGCFEVKPVSEFGKESRAKNGYKPRCKKCCNADYNSRYPKFKENKLAVCKVRYQNKKEEITKVVNAYYEKNKVKILAYNKEYRLLNTESRNKSQRKYHDENKLTNLRYRTTRAYRKLLYRLKVNKYGKTTSEMLGYTYSDLIIKLGREPNIDEAVDHKIPVSWFLDIAEVRLINHLDNLQILTKTENGKKLNSFCHPVNAQYFELIKDKIKPKYLTKIKSNGTN